MSIPLIVLTLIVFGAPSFVVARLAGSRAWAMLLFPPVLLLAIAFAVGDSEGDWVVAGIVVGMVFVALGVFAGRLSAGVSAD